MSGDDSPLSRRRQRRTGSSNNSNKSRQRDSGKEQQQQQQQQQDSSDSDASSVTSKGSVPSILLDATSPTLLSSSASSIEDLFGLGNEQLRELNEQVLPLPREDLVTGKEVLVEDRNKVFKLPDLAEFMRDTGGTGKSDRNREADRKEISEDEDNKIDRKNTEEYARAMQLNPFADADDSMFINEYDIFQSIFGSGKLCGVPIPYLQTNHGILLFISLLGALVYAPGNPLTELPLEIRTFLTQGLLITYSINLLLAINSFFIARSKNLPGVFWLVKVFLLGGISYYELQQTKDPTAASAYSGTKPQDRKARSDTETVMKGREKNSSFFNNQKQGAISTSLSTKLKLAKSQGVLNLSSCQPPLRCIPPEVFRLDQCNLDDNEKFWEHEPLKSFDVSFNQVRSVPDEVGSILVDCLTFKLRDNLVEVLPESFYEGCTSLRHVDLGSNSMQTISERVVNLYNLKELLLNDNRLIAVPSSLMQCASLSVLDLHGNQITQLPAMEPWSLTSLITLNISNNQISALPKHLSEVISLESINCSHNKIDAIPDLRKMVSLRYLDASQNQLGEFPLLPYRSAAISQLNLSSDQQRRCPPPPVNQLSHLVLGYNRLTAIDVASLQHHKMFSELLLNNNQLSQLPDDMELLGSLKILDVSNNNLKDLPPGLGYMPLLQRIKADGNPIRCIRQNVLVKPTNELKLHLCSRGPSMFEETRRDSGSFVEDTAPPSAATATVRVGASNRAGSDMSRRPNRTGDASSSTSALGVDQQVTMRIRDMSSSGLDLSSLSLQRLPAVEAFRDMVLSVPLGATLHSVNLSRNRINSFPFSIGAVRTVKTLDLSDNTLGSIPTDHHLRNLDTYYSQDYELNLTSIDVSKNDLSSQTMDILLQPLSLLELVGNCNPLQLIPLQINNQRNLHTLRLSYCQLTSMLELNVHELIHLVTLDLSNNKITTIFSAIYSPNSINNNNSRLEYFSIENNNITDIPAQLSLCPRLKVLLIAGNPQRTVRMNIVQQGSPKVLEFLKSRLPVQAKTEVIPTAYRSDEASIIQNGGIDPRMYVDRQSISHSGHRNQMDRNAQVESGNNSVNDPRTVMMNGEHIRSVDGAAVMHSVMRDDRSSSLRAHIDGMKADMSQVISASVFQPGHLLNRSSQVTSSQVTHNRSAVPIEEYNHPTQRRGNTSSSIQSILGGIDSHEQRRSTQYRGGGMIVLDTKANNRQNVLDKRY